MLTKLESALTRGARWPMIGFLALLSAFILLLFPVFTPAAPGAQPALLDTRLWYTPAEVDAALTPLTPAQRRAAAVVHLTLDVLFPLAYGTLFALLLLKAWPGSGMWKLALAAATADLGENLALAALYAAFPAGVETLTPVAASWTALKWGLFTLMLLAVVTGAALRWRNR